MPAQRFRQTIGPQMQIPATTPAAQDSTERKGDSVASQIEEHEATARGTAERPARSQVLFREVNERIAELSMPLEGVGMNLLVCECSDVGCAESLEVTPAEYEAVRARANRFVVLVGHQRPGIERVVDGNTRFLVVETTGKAAAAAIESDWARS